jgi:hypothetical protein
MEKKESLTWWESARGLVIIPKEPRNDCTTTKTNILMFGICVTLGEL